MFWFFRRFGVKAATDTGTGTAAGTSTAAAVGASLASAAGTAAGTSTAGAVGAALAAGAGAAAGTATAAAVGSSVGTSDAVGSAAGTSTAVAVSEAASLAGRLRRRGRYVLPSRWAVEEAYEEIRAVAEIRQELRGLVAPYLEGQMPARAAPRTSSIDWDAMQNDSETLYRLVVLWEEVIEEEETIILLGEL